MRCRQIYAVYRGDENLGDGTAEELGKKLNIKPASVRYMASQAYLRKRKSKEKCLIVIRLGKERGNNND